MRLNTPRLELVPFSVEDKPELHALFIDPFVKKHLLDGAVMPEAWVQELIDSSHERFAHGGIGMFSAVEKDSGAIAGAVGFRTFAREDGSADVELVFALLPAYTKQGLGTEMVKRVVDVAKKAGVWPLRATANDKNEASKRLLAKLGFVATGERKGKRHNLVVFEARNPPNVFARVRLAS